MTTMQSTSRFYANNVSFQTLEPINTVVTSIKVGGGSPVPGIPSGKYFKVTLESGGVTEVVKVTAVTGNTLVCVRAQEGTTAHEFPVGSKVELRATAESFNTVVSDLDTVSVSLDLLASSLSALSKDMFEE